MSNTISGNEKTKEEIEKIATQKRSGNHKIYPILKPGNWGGLRAGAVSSTLIGDNENPQVVVGYGYDTPENFVFLTNQDLKTMDGNQIIADSFKNLEEFVTDFEYSEAFENKLLTSSGRDFSSERILSVNHMLKAHKMLESEELLVTIPRRTCMMVISRDAENKLLNAFVNFHQQAWEDDSYGNAPIANMLYVVKEGNIVGTIPLNK
ncbi:hypothetical protein KO500_10010 [Cellulophaga baltica]|uniref:hypothetical protein n=1 Tax=Cellulophaga TaxID=104264 RepID=UPI001C06FA5B|nr:MULTISPECIES: hypothetical protein [Cellulophaga]MBU2996771.1 hypothetical protein [Cellulophaga baltica]MDO6768167.1 hypothetical protein [Cellulophaga sp. 1_MG-2023]